MILYADMQRNMFNCPPAVKSGSLFGSTAHTTQLDDAGELAKIIPSFLHLSVRNEYVVK